MNAIAEREYLAHELAERRRAYIAGQIRRCLYGEIEFVTLAYTYPAITHTERRADLIECMENELIVLADDYSARLLAALDDDSMRPTLRELRDSVIERWACHTHDSMTRQELEALPC